MFHNTNSSGATEEAQMKVNNAKQEDQVLAIFAHHKELSPTQCHDLYKVITGKYKTPLTSIRRAISDLTRQDRLDQTTKQITGAYGKSESVWVFKTMHNRHVDEERKNNKKPSSKAILNDKKKVILEEIDSVYSNVDSMVLIEIKNHLLSLRAKIESL